MQPSATLDRSTRTRLPRAERRRQLLRAAAGVFVAGGFDGASMEDVARAAGVTRLIVYRIFETKEALYRAVLDAVVDDVITRFDAREAMPEAARHPIPATLHAVAREHPDGFRLLWRHAAHEPAFSEMAAAFREGTHGFAESLLAHAVADGELRRWAAESVAAHVYESICLWLDHGDVSRDDAFLALLTDGVRGMVDRWQRAGR